jgi:vitamin B12 transporter
MKKKFLFVAAVFTSSLIRAQNLPDSITVNDPVTITATKTLRKQSETGKVVTVINKTILQNNLGKSVSDILNQQAGIVVVGSQNAPGANQDLYLRGSGKVLILIDGVPVYDASTIGNSFDLNSIAIESLEKIEILKGGQSTLYGSDAVAGVVNLITNKTGKKEAQGYISAAAGSFGTFKGSIGINGTTDGTHYNAQYSRLTTNGFSAAFDSVGNKNFDKDGLTQNTFNGSLNGVVAKNFTVGISTQFSNYKADVDGSAFVDDIDFTINNTNFNAALHATYQLKKGSIHYALGLNTAVRKYLNDSGDVSGFAAFEQQQYIGRSYFTDLYTNQKLHEKVDFIIGVDYRWQNSDQDYLSLSAFGPYKTTIGKDSVKQDMKSVYASVLLKNLNGFNLEVGGRYNNHSSYGNNTTFTLNPSFNINDKLKLFANVSSAFKAPSLYQLNGPGVANRKLNAEKSITYEGGLQYSSMSFTTRAVYFNRLITDGIDYNFNTFQYFNNNKQNDRGVELEIAAKQGKFNFTANYAYVTGTVNAKKFEYNPTTFAYDVKGDTTFNNLFRRPQHCLSTTISYQPIKSLHFGTTARLVGKRFEAIFDAAPKELKSYYTVDLFGSYTIYQKYRFFVDVRNLTDQQFFDVLGYTSRRNNFMAGLQIMF